MFLRQELPDERRFEKSHGCRPSRRRDDAVDVQQRSSSSSGAVASTCQDAIHKEHRITGCAAQNTGRHHQTVQPERFI